MATKRTRRLRGRRPQEARDRLAYFTLSEVNAFLSAWSPAMSGRTWRWATWLEYLDDYAVIREELLAERHADLGSPFGDLVARFLQTHGAEALREAQYADIRDDDATGQN